MLVHSIASLSGNSPVLGNLAGSLESETKGSNTIPSTISWLRVSEYDPYCPRGCASSETGTSPCDNIIWLNDGRLIGSIIRDLIEGPGSQYRPIGFLHLLNISIYNFQLWRLLYPVRDKSNDGRTTFYSSI
jgi:hypothetical protein